MRWGWTTFILESESLARRVPASGGWRPLPVYQGTRQAQRLQSAPIWSALTPARKVMLGLLARQELD